MCPVGGASRQKGRKGGKMRKVGAPKGGRVHWLLWHLPREFKGKYILSYNYALHNYVFYRMSGRKLYDVFIVKQSSTHYWRAMYVNTETQKYEYFAYRNTRIIAEYMVELYRNSDGREQG